MMMRNIPISVAACLSIAAVPVLCHAETPDEIFGKGVAFLQSQQFDQAQDEFSKMIDQFGKNAMADFGPRFGAIYYHRALAYQGQGKFGEAISDFETAASKFPNKVGEARVNPYQTISLLMAGNGIMNSKEVDYAKALQLFQQFEQQMKGNPLDRDNVIYNRAAFWGNMAICEAKLGRPKNAAALIAKILKDEGGSDRATRTTFEKTTQLIQSASVEVMDAFLKTKDIAEGVKFLNENKAGLRSDPGVAYYYAPRYLQIASEATKAGHYDYALGIYSLIPTTQEALEGLETNARDKNAAPQANGKPSQYATMLGKIKEKLVADRDGGTPLEVYALDGTARIFQINGNYQAVYGIYRTMVHLFPKSKIRPEILYYTALAASVIGRLDETQKYGELFIKEFPQHELRAKVEELMVEGMFWNGRYEDALRIAQAVRPRMADGSKGAELCDFVIGGSLYFLGRYAEAEPVLRQHVETYKESTHREMARFYNADNLARLNKFTEAGTLLDSFLKDYPDSSVLDLALYARANCHYNLSQPDGAISRLNEFIGKRPFSQIRDQANNLFGNVFESQEKPADAEQSYRKAKEIAEQFGHTSVAAESMIYLMGLLGKVEGKTDDVVALYDEFFKKYGDSMNRAKAAVIPLEALEKKNRLPEAMKRLEEIIAGFGNDVDAVGLEDCIVSYANNAEKAGMTLEQLRERLYNFPGLAPEADVARARLRMALIDVYDKKIRDEKDDAKKNRLKGEIEGLFAQLKRDFDPAKMPNYTLNRIGDFLMKTGLGDQAKPYFNQVMKNADTSFRDKAQFNLATILGESTNPADRKEAIDLLDGILKDYSTDLALCERVTRQKAITYELGQDWPNMEVTWLAYLKNQGWAKYQTEAYFMLATSQEQQKKWKEALVNYLQVFSLDTGNLLYSSPSWLRFAQLQYSELGNKQQGYEQLYGMVQKIGHLEEAEKRLLEVDAPANLDPMTKKRLAKRLTTNYLTQAKETLAAWEAAGGINLIVPDPKKK